jgi:hypothetical protein
MNWKLIGIVAGALVLCIVMAVAAFADAASINRFFANLLLFIDGATSLIEPSKGLLESIGALVLVGLVVMQGITMRRQTIAKDERAVQTAVLADQNQQLSHITQQVQAVKVAVVPPQDAV